MIVNRKNIANARVVCANLTALIFIAISLPCHAQQNWSAGFYAGIAATRVWNGHSSSASGYYFQAAPLVGLQVRHIVTNQFSVAGELIYDKIRSKKEGLSALAPGTVPKQETSSTYYA